MSIRRSFLVILFLTVASCADSTAPRMPDTFATSAGGGHRVVGSGHVQGAAGLREFTFHAAERPHGGVGGSYKVVLASGLFFEADVTCLAVDGSTGWVAGVIRATNADAGLLGTRTMFYAIDGGEGEGTTDIVSIAVVNAAPGTDLAFCADRPLELAPMAVTDGNVQVR